MNTVRMEKFSIGGHPVRGIEEDGQLWFIGQDVAKALGVSTGNLKRDLEEHEQGLTRIATKGGTQRVKTISGRGLISLIYRSRKDSTQHLKDWASDRLLPYLGIRIVETKSTAGVNSREERVARRVALRAIR